MQKLNVAITTYNLNADALEKDRGLPLANFSENFKVSGTMVRLRILLTRLPLILHSIENLNHQFFNTPQYECIKLLISIVSFTFSPVLLRDHIPHFEQAIDKFLKLMYKTFDASIIKPKFHHLIHYPGQIYNYGPLRYHATLPNERLHSHIYNAW